MKKKSKSNEPVHGQEATVINTLLHFPHWKNTCKLHD